MFKGLLLTMKDIFNGYDMKMFKLREKFEDIPEKQKEKIMELAVEKFGYKEE